MKGCLRSASMHWIGKSREINCGKEAAVSVESLSTASRNTLGTAECDDRMCINSTLNTFYHTQPETEKRQPMKKETFETWLIQLDSMVAELTKARRLGGLYPKELQALKQVRDTVDSFEGAIEEQKAMEGIRYSGGSALDRKG